MSDILSDLDRTIGTPTPVGISEQREISIEEDPEDDLLIELEGDIGDNGSNKGTAGGASGNPSDSEPAVGSDDWSDAVNEAVGSVVPEWVRNLGKATIAIGGVSIAFQDDPVRFIQAAISKRVIEFVAFVSGSIASTAIEFVSIFTGAFGSAGAAVLGSFGSVGTVLISLIDVLNNTIGTLAAAAGPLSPIVVVIIYGGMVVVVAGAVRTALVATGFAP